jgi:DNA-binding MarR family transcriptional regulator
MSASSPPPKPTGAAFLLAQLGSHAAQRFSERVAKIDLIPPHAGILRMIVSMQECSQQALAERLDILPSRVVTLIDELEAKDLIKRQRSKTDRRAYALVLTKRGQQTLVQLSKLAAEHEADLCAALTADELHTLTVMCRKIADQQGLKTGVHPGYRSL